MFGALVRFVLLAGVLLIGGSASAQAPCARVAGEVRVHLDVAFARGGVKLDRGARATLDEVARCLADAPPTTRIHVEGHSDDRGGTEAARRVSERRARNTARYLVRGGVPDAWLVVSGVGHLKPLETNRTPAGRAQNRRVELRTETTSQAAPAAAMAPLAPPTVAATEVTLAPAEPPSKSAALALASPVDASSSALAGNDQTVEPAPQAVLEADHEAKQWTGWQLLSKYGHWSALGASVAVAGVGGVFGLLARRDEAAMKAEFRGNRAWHEARDAAERKALAADLLWGVSLVGAGVTGWLFYRHYSKDRRPPAQLDVAPVAGGAQLRVRGEL